MRFLKTRHNRLKFLPDTVQNNSMKNYKTRQNRLKFIPHTVRNISIKKVDFWWKYFILYLLVWILGDSDVFWWISLIIHRVTSIKKLFFMEIFHTTSGVNFRRFWRFFWRISLIIHKGDINKKLNFWWKYFILYLVRTSEKGDIDNKLIFWWKYFILYLVWISDDSEMFWRI